MNDYSKLREGWLHEQEIAKIRGWDFSHIDGRYEESPLPWDFGAIIRDHLSPKAKLLDIDTGGGEFLRSLGHPLSLCSATEAYPPNAALCRETLAPLGIDFREANAHALPFEDEAFDLVIDRHGDLDAAEFHRVLKKGGYFLTQQVGADNDRELVELLLGKTPLPYPEARLSITRDAFARAGFEIPAAEEVFCPIRFFDVGALVWFARIIEWEFAGFSVERCFDRLIEAQKILDEQGAIEANVHRYLLIARREL